MRLVLQRLARQTQVATFGELRVDDVFQCYTLEPPPTAPHPDIPPGTYPVALQWSPKFGEEVPHVLDVPGRTAIEVHVGNEAQNTSGCLLVGRVLFPDRVAESRAAFVELVEKLKVATDPITLEVRAAEA